MSTNSVSPFQVKDWNIVNFTYSRGMLFIPADVSHQWTLHTHIEKLESQDESLRAIIDFSFKMIAEHEENQLSLAGDCLALCFLATDGLNNAEELFEKLIKSSAMLNILANLRVFLMQQSLLLQVGPKKIMLPFINLNDFRFDEDIVITV